MTYLPLENLIIFIWWHCGLHFSTQFLRDTHSELISQSLRSNTYIIIWYPSSENNILMGKNKTKNKQTKLKFMISSKCDLYHMQVQDRVQFIPRQTNCQVRCCDIKDTHYQKITVRTPLHEQSYFRTLSLKKKKNKTI